MKIFIAVGVLGVNELTGQISPKIGLDAALGFLGERAGLSLIGTTHPNLQDILFIGREIGEILTVVGELGIGALRIAEEDSARNQRRKSEVSRSRHSRGSIKVYWLLL